MTKFLEFVQLFLFFAGFTYPLWGSACVLGLLVKRCPEHARLDYFAVKVAAVGTLCCTPVLIGTEGFGWIAPWPVIFYTRGAGTYSHWIVPVLLFSLIYFSNIFLNKKARKHAQRSKAAL